MIERTLFSPDHEAFRDSFRRFIDKEIAPFHEAWEEQGYVDRAVWNKAGENGFLCMTMPEAYGGADADKLYSVVQFEELSRAGVTGIGYSLHSEIVAPYILHYGTEEQKQVPAQAGHRRDDRRHRHERAGRGLGPAGHQVHRLQQADGSYLLNGSKTFITNGWHADLVIVVAKTNPAAGGKGTSLLLVERGMPGFSVGKRLKKLGLKAQDTSELFFDNVRVPAENLLGGAAMENRGFICLMEQLPWERLQIAITAVAAAQSAIDQTVAYVKERKVFGQAVGAFQNTRYTLAELQTEVQVARVFVDKCCELVCQDKLDTATASMAKYWCSDLQCKVMDECVQLFGGYGYMWEYPITRAYADARVQRIYGGTNEIMKEVISRGMGLGGAAGVEHAERYGPHGATYWVARRS
jgi:alkylation response protein AidB-like acyl-CoA dehydrogenase